MPRYFFHTNNPATPDDTDGHDFETIGLAKREAVRFAGQLLADRAEHFWDTADFEMSVTDEKGLILFTLRILGTEAPAIRMRAPQRG